MNSITVICNVPHNITEGSCALCERDRAIVDAQRYRTLRAMFGVVNVEIGRIAGLEEHSFTTLSPEELRRAVDAALDQRFVLDNKPSEQCS